MKLEKLKKTARKFGDIKGKITETHDYQQEPPRGNIRAVFMYFLIEATARFKRGDISEEEYYEVIDNILNVLNNVIIRLEKISTEKLIKLKERTIELFSEQIESHFHGIFSPI